MKKITILATILLFAFTGFAQQEKINWLTTAEFEKAVKKENKNCFIAIEKEEKTFKMHNTVIEYLNKNFICYKFNTSSKGIKFLGKQYKKISKESHEFTDFLTGRRNHKVPAIVLRDQKFNHFTFNPEPIPGNTKKKGIKKSVWPSRGMSVHTLDYFVNGSYKKTDLKSFVKSKKIKK